VDFASLFADVFFSLSAFQSFSLLSGRGFVDDVGEFGAPDLGEGFAAVFEFLEGFDEGLGHAFVRFLGAANDGELVGGGDAFVAVLVVEADAEDSGDGAGGLPGFFRGGEFARGGLADERARAAGFVVGGIGHGEKRAGGCGAGKFFEGGKKVAQTFLSVPYF